MRKPNDTRPHTSTPSNPARRAPKERLATWQLSPGLLSEAVVAGYIHDISVRHGVGSAQPSHRKRGER